MKSITYLSTLFLAGFLLLASPAELRAQQTQDLGALTLQEAIELAQEQSPEARLARFRMISGRWQYRAYRANLLPGLRLQGNAPNYNKRIFPNTLDDGTVVYQSQVQSNASTRLSINQNIPVTGGDLSLSTGLSRLGVFTGESSYLWGSTPLEISLNQPLFQFNSLKWQNEIEPLRYEIAQKQYVQTMEEIAQVTAEQFFNAYLAQVRLENARFNMASNDSIHTINRTRYEAGDISENDLLQSELQMKDAEVNLSNAEINYERALNNFKIFLGYLTEVNMSLTPPEELPQVDVQVDRAVQLAMQNNNEALQYELQEVVADREYARAKSQSNLQMNLQANYGVEQTSTRFANLYDEPENSQFLTMTFQIPIFNWGRQRALVNQARNEQQRTATQIDYDRRQFVQSVETQVREFLQRDTQVEIARESDKIAQRLYDVAQTRYLIGDYDIEFLFQAQARRGSARERYIQELRQFWVGLYNLRSLTLYNFRENHPIDHEL